MIQLLTHKKNRNFQRLWWAQLVSQFGDRIHQLALVGLVAEKRPESAMALAQLMAFTILPVFLVQPVAGIFVDRWNHRMTLFVCDVLRALLVLLIPLFLLNQDSMVPIYVIVFLVFTCSRFYVPAKMSIIPDVVENKDLLKANALFSTTGMLAFALGAAIGGLVVEFYGAKRGFWIDAGTFMLSGLLLWSMDLPRKIQEHMQKLRTDPPHMIQQEKVFWKQDMVDGWNYIKDHSGIRFILAVLAILLAAGGAVYVVLVVFVQESFGSVTLDLVYLAGSLGVGLMIGALLYGKFGKHIHYVTSMFLGLTAGGMMLCVFTALVQIWPNMLMACGLALGWGIAVGPIFIAANTLTHLVSEESMRGKVFSMVEIVIHLAFLVAMMISSWLADHMGRHVILMGVGVLVIMTGLIGWGMRERIKAQLDLSIKVQPETVSS